MQRKTRLFIGLCWAVVGVADPGTLTLDEAFSIAKKNAPELRAARINVKAAKKSIEAAVFKNNPTLEFEAENVGGGDSTEYTLALSQTYRRGGKSARERAVAQQAVQVVRHQVALAELELEVRVRSAFFQVLAQREIATVRKEQERLAREFVEVAQKRHEAGGASELEVLQADLALEEVLLEQKSCLGDLDTARQSLASLIGIPLELLGELEGAFFELVPPPMGLSETHPALLEWADREKKLEAEADLSLAQDTVDYSLGAGVRYNSAFDEASYLFSVSIPLSLSRRGRAESMATLLQAEAIRSESEKVRRDLEIEFSTTLAAFKSAAAEVDQYRLFLLPKAEKVYALSWAGYDAGRYSWLELITAQQHLSELRIRYIEALSASQQALAKATLFAAEKK